MNQFQPFDFRNVSEMLDFLPEKELKITEQLRQIVFDCITDAKEKLAYNVPFYYRHSRICFIWPGSVPWGKVKEGVQLGFCKGNLLSDVGYLDTGKRKNVYTKTFHHTGEIDRDKISQLLLEAAWIDEEEKKMTSKRSKQK